MFLFFNCNCNVATWILAGLAVCNIDFGRFSCKSALLIFYYMHQTICSLQGGGSDSDKLPLRKLLNWDIVTWEIALGNIPLG